MTKIYDLDGTLSKLNNTFDFIFMYFKHEKKYFRYYFSKVVDKAAYSLFFLPYYIRRKIIINSMFFGLSKKKLIAFWNNHYSDIFLKRLTKLGKDRIGKSNDIMLTGCTEIPAKQISRLFSFKSVISTEFSYFNGRIVGISKDTFGNLKSGYINRRPNDRFTYYTDNLEVEQSLKKIMDKIIIV